MYNILYFVCNYEQVSTLYCINKYRIGRSYTMSVSASQNLYCICTHFVHNVCTAIHFYFIFSMMYMYKTRIQQSA